MARHTITAGVGIAATATFALLIGLGAAPAALADQGPTADDIASVLTAHGLGNSSFGGSTTLDDAATALADNPETDVFGGHVTASEVANVFNSDGIAYGFTSTGGIADYSNTIAFDLNHVIPSGSEIDSVLSADGVTNSDFTGATTVGQVANALAAYHGIDYPLTDTTDIFGGSVSANQVTAALGIDGYQFARGSDVNATDIAADLNGATPPPGATNIAATYSFPDGNPDTGLENGTPVDDQGYSLLFGAEGSVGAHNAALDASLFQADPATAAGFYKDVTYFEEGNFHPFTDLLHSIDPSAFATQTFDGIHGAYLPDGGAYLIPTDFLGYLATETDFVLNGNGLSAILDPAVNLLGAGATDFGLSI
jgi:hypothetical protein